MARSYDQKLTAVTEWVTVINEFWDQHQGLLNNQRDFWDTVLHSMTDQDWNDVYVVADVLSKQHPEDFRKFPGFAEALLELNKRILLGKPVIRKYDRQHYNKAPFKVIMSVKDKINELLGQPTKQYAKEEHTPLDEPKTAYEKRRYRREINIQIQETLFEITD